MVVSTYLEGGKFGGFRTDDNIPDGFFVASVDYPTELIDGYYNAELNQWYENASAEEIKSLIVPNELSRMKFIIQINRTTGIRYEQIEVFINNIPDNILDDNSKYEIITRLKAAVDFNRYDTDLLTISQMMGITSGQLDSIFINGNLIE